MRWPVLAKRARSLNSAYSSEYARIVAVNISLASIILYRAVCTMSTRNILIRCYIIILLAADLPSRLPFWFATVYWRVCVGMAVQKELD